jgi:hypothetical protein
MKPIVEFEIKTPGAPEKVLVNVNHVVEVKDLHGENECRISLSNGTALFVIGTLENILKQLNQE